MHNITGLKIRSSSFTYLKLMSRQKGQENTGFQKDPPSLCLKSKPDLGWVVGQAFVTHCRIMSQPKVFLQESALGLHATTLQSYYLIFFVSVGHMTSLLNCLGKQASLS